MNIELLRRVRDRIRRLRHKRHFDMDPVFKKTSCGTAACIAGWALLESGYKVKFEKGSMIGDEDVIVKAPTGEIVDDEIEEAQKILGLTINQADRLFNASNWPKKFGGSAGKWDQKDAEQYNDPKVAAARIERFIETKGRV